MLAVRAIFALALLLPSIFAAPHVVRRSPTGQAVPDSYIVIMKSPEAKVAQLQSLSAAVYAADDIESYSEITYDKEYEELMPHAYAAILKGKALEAVLSDPNVAVVEENGIFTLDDEVDSINPPVEITARDEVSHELTKRQGAGATVYILDTGILTTHTQFGTRATFGATFGGYAARDGNGHGTHCAGIAAGSTFGQAPGASLVAVKVLSDGGSGTFADVTAGVNWIATDAAGKLAVVNVSLGGTASSGTVGVETAVSNAIARGIHFSIAAGNSNADAASFSPARVSTANTVGAIDSSNRKASFSNYGAVLDIQAPGVSILSSYIGSNTATATLSGTSMAAPFVAGILARRIAASGNTTPANLTSLLRGAAQAVATGFPSGTTNLKATVF